MPYNPQVTCEEIDKPELDLVCNEPELSGLLDSLGVPRKYRKDITAAIVKVSDGDYDAVWLSESGRYFDHSAWYHPLPYYRPVSWRKKNLPCYWLESNKEYSL